jgi:DNA polymerase V
MAKKDITAFFGKVLREARLIAGLSQEELALESDLDRTYISMLERNIKIPTLSTLVKLAPPLSISPAQLLVRAQQMEQGEGSLMKSPKKTFLKPPFYGTSVSCGQPLGGDYFIEKELSLDEFMIKHPSETFFVKASGDSMQPVIWDGDLLIISQHKKPQNGSIVLAQVENEFTVKRYYKTTKGIRLVPENSHFKEVLLAEEGSFWICGVIVGTTRQF